MLLALASCCKQAELSALHKDSHLYLKFQAWLASAGWTAAAAAAAAFAVTPAAWSQ
jgi:hypothetical protein